MNAGRDPLMRIALRESVGDAEAQPQGDEVRSRPILDHCRWRAARAPCSGDHDGGAAIQRVRAIAHRFARGERAQRRVDHGARSGEGDEVTVVATGSDAQAAVDAISQLLATHAEAEAAEAAAVPASTTPSVPVQAAPKSPQEPGVLRGVPASPGVAVGNVHHLQREDAVFDDRAQDAQQERRALDAALATAHTQLDALRAGLASDPDRAAIFGAHQELLADPELLDQATQGIREGGSAAWAWKRAYTAQSERLLALKNELFAGRAADMRDVGRRVLHLLVGSDGAAPAVPPDSIIVAEDLAPSDAASLDRTHVRGFCTTSGSATSHAAILARGLGIPGGRGDRCARARSRCGHARHPGR